VKIIVIHLATAANEAHFCDCFYQRVAKRFFQGGRSGEISFYQHDSRNKTFSH